MSGKTLDAALNIAEVENIRSENLRLQSTWRPHDSNFEQKGALKICGRSSFDQKFRFEFPKFSYAEWNSIFHQGRVVRNLVNAKPGLKVNWGNNFSCIKVLSIAYVLCTLRLLMLKTDGQKI